MRTTVLALSLLVAGCTTPSKIQPSSPPYRDHKTPVALQKPSITRRIVEQRHMAAEVASGEIAVDGQLVR